MTDPAQQIQEMQAQMDALKKEYHEFAYIVSHDFNAPFRQIEGFAHLLSKRKELPLDDKAKRHLDLIMQGASKCQSLIEALLDFSRLNTQEVVFENVDGNALTANALQRLEPMIDASGAVIEYDEIPELYGDRYQLSQLLYHLLHNALTYRQPGVALRISIDAKDEGNQQVISIHDNGIGILPKHFEHIFIALRRAVTDADYPGGRGMGLAIAKNIAKRHNGHIAVESEIGKGSTFTLSLPKGA